MKIFTSVHVIWLFLVALTLASWLLGERQIQHEGTAWLSTLMLVIGFYKVRLVGLHFMELRHAPWLLRGVFEFWVVAVCLLLLFLYGIKM